ncbi:MAG TPA: TonB-dependent receptor [Stellaceae bacterium]|nr:TonB-dependent receptor [Stellaceae bacterium]
MDSSTLGARGRVLPVARHAFSLAGIAGAVAGAMLGGKVPALAAESDPASQQAQATPDAAPAPQPSGPQGAATPTFEEVTTTARQRAENVQDVPIPVTVLSGDHLEDTGTDKFQQLQFAAPSTSVFLSNPRQAGIAIRGLGNNPANDGLQGSVGIYVDGVYFDRDAMASFGLYDINQIEVLRGPQGTLFGKNTTAGALNITTNAPTFTPEVDTGITYGSFNTQEYTAVINGPIVDNVLAGRLSIESDSHSGYVKSTEGNSYDGLNLKDARGQLLFQDGDIFSLRLSGDYGLEHDNSGFSILYSPGPASSAKPGFTTFAEWSQRVGVPAFIDPNDFKTNAVGEQVMKQETSGASATADWKLPDGFALTSISAIRTWSFQPQNNGFDYFAPPTIGNGIPISQQDVSHDVQASEELRLASPVGGPVDFVAGLYYFWKRLAGDQETTFAADASTILGTNPVLNGAETKVDTDPTTNSAALFSQANWHISDRWTLTGGVRETFEQDTIHILQYPVIDPASTPPASLGFFTASDTIRNWSLSGLISPSYKITQDVLAYLSLSHGAKAGGFNSPAVPAFSGATFLPVSTLVVYPEKADDVELGVKSTLFDHRLTLNADAFLTRVTDYQANTTIPLANGGNVSELLNVGAVTSKGFEVDAVARPIVGLSIVASGSYDLAQYQSFRNAPAVEGATAASQDLSGRPVVGAPKWTASASGTYTWPVAAETAAYVTAEYAYKSAQYGFIDDSSFSRLNAYGIANFRVGTNIADRYDVALWVQNAFNTANFYSTSTVTSGLGGYTAAPGIPRVFGITVRAKF